MIVAAVVLLRGSSASAADPCGEGAPHLGLEVLAAPGLKRTVTVDIESGMQRRGLAVCADDSADAGKVGRLRVDASSLPRVVISMVDDITDKEVIRTLDLSDLPPDGHSLAIAIAAEELARASWAELALRPSPSPAPRKPKKRAPAAVRAVVESDLADPPGPSSRDDNSLRLVGGVDHYTTPLTLFGPDVTYRRRLVAWLWLEIGGHFRTGLGVSTPRGEVATLTAGGGVALSARPVELDSFAFELDAGVRAFWLRFDGNAAPGSLQDQLSTWAAVARGGASIVVIPTPHLELAARFGAGVPLRAVYAADDGEDVTGIGGAELSSTLGLGVTF